MKSELFHRRCKKIAFTYDGKWSGVPLFLKETDVTLPNGKHPENGSPIVCGSCGNKINIASDVYVKKFVSDRTYSENKGDKKEPKLEVPDKPFVAVKRKIKKRVDIFAAVCADQISNNESVCTGPTQPLLAE